MQSVLDLLKFLEDNWAIIVAIATALFGLYQAAKREIMRFRTMSEAEQQNAIHEAQNKAIEEARKALATVILKLCSDAEIAWADAGSKLGPVKRAEVIDACFTKYPVLLTVTDQEELLAYIDKLIDEALKTVREKIRVE